MLVTKHASSEKLWEPQRCPLSFSPLGHGHQRCLYQIVYRTTTNRPTIIHSQDGNVNVIANDIGDRITPAILSVMHAEETLVGVPAKSNIVRNRSATVANNKQFFEPNLSESDFDDYSTNW